MQATETAGRFSLFSESAPDDWLDELLGLAAAARELPGSRNAKTMHASSLFRKITEGKLRAVRCGRRLVTSRRWIREWMQREMEQYSKDRGIGQPTPRTSAAGDRAALAAAKSVGYPLSRQS
jgi:hypothetical protein